MLWSFQAKSQFEWRVFCATDSLCEHTVTANISLSYDLCITCLFSVQPGNGTRYVRHYDSFADSASTATSTASTPKNSPMKPGDETDPISTKSGSSGKSTRRLTFLYYLNETHDGGQLRVHNIPPEYSTSAVTPLSPNEPSAKDTANTHMDIEPVLGRLVVFRRFVPYCIPLLLSMICWLCSLQ